MRQPSLDVLMSKTDSKYALVVAASKRARLITEGTKPLVTLRVGDSTKPVSLALDEIAAGHIHIEAPQGGIK